MGPFVQLSFRDKPVYLDLSEVAAIGPEIEVIDYGREKIIYRVVYLRGGATINIDDNNRNMVLLLDAR